MLRLPISSITDITQTTDRFTHLPACSSLNLFKMSYSLAIASLAFLAALGNELRRMFQRGNGGVDFGIVAARGTLGSVVWGLVRLGRLGDVLAALGPLPFLLILADMIFSAVVRPNPAVVRATPLLFAFGLVLVTVDFTVNRCVGHSHSILDRFLTMDGVNRKLAEEYVKWRRDYDVQLQHLTALTGDLSSTSKEFNARLPLFRGGSEAGPRRPNCTFWTFHDVKMEEFNIFHRLCKSALSSHLLPPRPSLSHAGPLASSGFRPSFHSNRMTDYQRDRVGEWYKARLFSVRSTVLANKKRIHELNPEIEAESKGLAELKVETEFEAEEQRRLRAPFWREGSRLKYQSRKAADSLAVVHVGSGLPPRRPLFGVQREAPFLPRPRPCVMAENDLPLHALAREESQRHPKFAPQQLAVARIDELYSHPPPVQYEMNPQEISDILHRDPQMQIMPLWQPVQVVPEVPDIEMTDAPALLEFDVSGTLGNASAAHGSMELIQPAEVVGLVGTFPCSSPYSANAVALSSPRTFWFRQPCPSSPRHLCNLHLCGFHPRLLPLAARPQRHHPMGLLQSRCLLRQQEMQLRRARP